MAGSVGKLPRRFKHETMIEGRTYDTIHQAAYDLFPDRKASEMIDLLLRMFELVAEDLSRGRSGSE